MAFHVFDGDRWQRFALFSDARGAARDAIDAHRDFCDPEWSDTVEAVGIYEAPFDCDSPDEDGTLLLIATEVEIPVPYETAEVDYWCDYVLKPPKGDPA